MPTATQYRMLLRTAAWVTASLVVVAVLVLLFARFSLPGTTEAGGPSPRPSASWAKALPLDQADWSIFRADTDTKSPSVSVSALAEHYRLAGTFFVRYDMDSDSVRKAMVDDLRNKEQLIVTEGDMLGDAEVTGIFVDRVVLRRDGREEELRLSFSGPDRDSDQEPATADSPKVKLMEGETAIATNRFGVQVAENRWVMHRNTLLDYCNELQDRPTRLEALFDSMQPVYENDPATGRRKITGYQLKVAGEADFYSAVGLREDDVVLKANLMPITSKRRAMFWIERFIDDQENAFVLDIERNGKPTRLQYLMR